MAWFNNSPKTIKDEEAEEMICRYESQRTKSHANPRSHTFGSVLFGPKAHEFLGSTFGVENQWGGIRFHRALTAKGDEILIGCGVTKAAMDIPGTYFCGAIVDPIK